MAVIYMLALLGDLSQGFEADVYTFTTMVCFLRLVCKLSFFQELFEVRHYQDP